jgi:hypothetical protein
VCPSPGRRGPNPTGAGAADGSRRTWPGSRETLRVFLATNGSYQTAGERLAIHKNTVQYRIRKAQEAIGRPSQDHRSDVELALRICHYLGSVVLRPMEN